MLKIILLYLIINFIIYRIKKSKRPLVEISPYYCVIFFKNKREVLFSSIVLSAFIIFFVFILRILRVFLKSNNTLDLRKYGNLLFDNFFLVEKILFIVLVIMCVFFVRERIFNIVKIHYFKLHYYYFCRFQIYLIFIKFITRYKYLMFLFLNENRYVYILINFLFKNGFKLFLVSKILFDIIFNNFVIGTQVFLWYALYIFIYNIIEFINKNIVFDFEAAILQYYFDDYFNLTCYGLVKINFYVRRLILINKYHDFMPNLLFDLESKINNEYPDYCLFFASFSKHLDVYELIKREKPRIPLIYYMDYWYY